MSKDFPSGFKKRKSKIRLPVPPPGGPHDPRTEYKRSRDRRLGDQIVEEAQEESDRCPTCGKMIFDDQYVEHVMKCEDIDDESQEIK